MTALIPVLETERLRMREPRLADFDAVVSMFSDAEFTRFLTGKPQSREETWLRLMRLSGHWNLMGYGFWALEDKLSGAFLGHAGYVEGRREMTPSLEGVPELGWSLAPAAQGKGYATEAVARAIRWGENHFGRVRMVCIIVPENAPSIRVAQRTGFHAVLDTVYKGEPIRLFQRDPQ
jgi:RimJ/RimL family protein N-acetyltransferase